MEQEDGDLAIGESAISVSAEKRDGCTLVSDQAGARSEGESDRDNFNIPGVSSVPGGGAPWLLITLAGLVVSLAAALAWVLVRGRRA
jgi:hypothetical protein